MNVSTAILAIIIIIISTLFFNFLRNNGRKKEGKSSPPILPRLPIIGSLPFMPGKSNYKYSHPYVTTKGPLIIIQIGSYDIYLINDLKLMKDALNQDSIAGKIDNVGTRLITSYPGYKGGYLFNEGKSWSQHKSFTLFHLKKYGFGKKLSSNLINSEVEELINYLGESRSFSSSSHVFNFDNNVFSCNVINIIWVILTGMRFDRHKSQKIFKLMTDFVSSKSVMALIYLPWTSYFLTYRLQKEIQSLIEDLVEEHKSSIDPNNSRDFIDDYLIALNKGNYSSFSIKDLMKSCLDLLGAGLETTSTTLKWIVLYLTRNPHIQEKCYREIVKTLGQDRKMAELSDQDQLPLINAFISEVLRIASVAVGTLPHKATVDTTIGEYKIPKESIVIGNIRNVHFSTEYWENPDEFNPYRFIDKETGKYVKNEALIPFSIGRRSCIGQAVAQDSLFLFTTSLLMNFKFDKLTDFEYPDHTNCISEFTMVAQDFKVIINNRH